MYVNFKIKVSYLIVGVVLMGSLMLGGIVLAGDPDSPGAPTDTASKSYTLEDIYQRLNSGTAATKSTFTEPVAGPATGTMHTLNDIYTLIDQRAPVPKTGITATSVLSDDGDLEKGVAWPNPRFTDEGNGTVTDNLTGLIWLKDADCMGQRVWGTGGDETFDVVSRLNGGENFSCTDYIANTHNDWRLPNVRELQSLVHYGFFSPAVPNTAGTGQWSAGTPFYDVRSGYYWSSSTFANNPTDAWFVYMHSGYVGLTNKTSSVYVWPVRGGQ